MVSKGGLDRLGLSKRISEVLSPDVCMRQSAGCHSGAVRLKDTEAADLLAPLDDLRREQRSSERALLRRLQGGCQVPMGAWARIERGELLLEASCLSRGRGAYAEAAR